MKSFIFKFILDKVKISFLIALLITIAIYTIFDYNVTVAYIGGFLTGCMNFILLSMSSYIIILARPTGAKFINTLVFLLRYSIVAIITVKFVLHSHYNIFAIAIGLVTMNISIVFSTLLSSKKKRSNYFLTGKEG